MIARLREWPIGTLQRLQNCVARYNWELQSGARL
jgi:hypothetical protein